MEAMSKLNVIYIPGLGDNNPTVQAKAVAVWKRYGVDPELFQMDWADDEPWKSKFDKLLARIDEVASGGQKVALVGVSAGAGAVINAYAARKDKIVGAVCILGKINNPQEIGDKYRDRNPSFIESAYAVPESLEKLGAEERKRIMSRYAVYDEIVPKEDSQIKGAKNQTLPGFFHAPTIAFQLVFGAPAFIKFLKDQV